ncbi:hypothetical protein BCR44DRAFT_1241583 [Catenaria anguillulae PL171]|uniref:RRM domain-containing protein n=1 Tax=Catenaria anguillulae PL171 TaxID=765915 RepID=A0A1Y2HCN0_9FUNG|nr:hypothetical protein BCR44DRAFT_1241583 [Catenaria anguillulae PL171]
MDSGPGDLGRDKGFGYSFGGAHHIGRYRSPSPAPDVVPLDKRPRKDSKWDIAPLGYENVPAIEAKATDNFLLPCHRAVMKQAPGTLLGQPGAMAAQQKMNSMMTGGPPGSAAFQARTARRLYFGNLPKDVTDTDLINFINQEMQRHGMEPSALTASFGGDRSFAFLEFREASHATTMLAYDSQWTFGGQTLRIKRPKDYVPQPGESDPVPPHLAGGAFGSGAPGGPHSHNPDKLFIGGIPRNLTEGQVRELLEAFGAIKTFNLIMDVERGESKGYAFCEYMDGALADVAIEGLNGMEIGDRRLVVQRASSGKKRDDSMMGTAPLPMSGGVDSDGPGPVGPPDGILVPALNAANGVGQLSRIMLLMNLASVDEVRQPHQMDELVQDVRDECTQFGKVVDVIVPQIPEPPKGSVGAPQPIVQVFVLFTDEFECQNVMRRVCGRTYRGRTVVAAYFPEARWESRDFYGAAREVTAGGEDQ